MKISKFWKSTKYKTSWDVYYRNCPSGTIFTSNNTVFTKMDVGNNCWAADPLLFTLGDKSYLFFEMLDTKKNKGSIACSEIVDSKISKPRIVLNEDFHLSFPFVFETDGTIYMIPESGEANSVILYKALDFPYLWKREKVLINDIHSSDSIVFTFNNKMFLIVSVMNSNAMNCSNNYYKVEPNFKISLFHTSLSSVKGQRNAGPMIFSNGSIIRPGQCSDGIEYGKSLCFFLVDKDTFEESLFKEVGVDDILIDSSKKYVGIHTYSSNREMEFIDLKLRRKNCFIVRLFMIIKRIFVHLRKPKNESNI